MKKEVLERLFGEALRMAYWAACCLENLYSALESVDATKWQSTRMAAAEMKLSIEKFMNITGMYDDRRA